MLMSDDDEEARTYEYIILETVFRECVFFLLSNFDLSRVIVYELYAYYEFNKHNGYPRLQRDNLLYVSP